MAIISNEQILKTLHYFNPWWISGAVHPCVVKEHHRVAYYKAMNQLDNRESPQTILISGLRRVGKTTIIYQMIDAMLQQGISPQRIVFIPLNHPILRYSGLSEILGLYHENVWAGQDCCCFFDEIQEVDGWGKWEEKIHELQPMTQIIATSSVNPALVKENTVNMIDRWHVIRVSTLSFFEYCSLMGVETPELPSCISPTDFSNMNQQEQAELAMKLSSVKNHFMRYLRVGGFPEFALGSEDIMARQSMWKSTVGRVLRRDLPLLRNIRSMEELELIFIHLCGNSSDIASITAIVNELGSISRPTVETYISFLEGVNLIYLSDPIELDGQKNLKTRSKIYVSDSAIRNAVFMDIDLLTSPAEMRKIVETAVYKHIVEFYTQRNAQVGYYRNVERGRKIDIVVEQSDEKKIFVDVNYQDQAVISGNSAICELSDDANSGIVLTKCSDDYGVYLTPGGGKIARMPAFAFLYLLGNAEWHKCQEQA